MSKWQFIITSPHKFPALPPLPLVSEGVAPGVLTSEAVELQPRMAVHDEVVTDEEAVEACDRSFHESPSSGRNWLICVSVTRPDSCDRTEQ